MPIDHVKLPISGSGRTEATTTPRWCSTRTATTTSAPLFPLGQTLLCLANYARRRQGLSPLSLSPVLGVAAAAKAADIDGCGKFEHAACGKSPDQVARDAGYRGSWGENLYVAEGPFVVPRVAIDQWLNSSGHRRNLFRPEWRTIGIALRPDVDVERFRDSVVWVNEFGA